VSVVRAVEEARASVVLPVTFNVPEALMAVDELIVVRLASVA